MHDEGLPVGANGFPEVVFLLLFKLLQVNEVRDYFNVPIYIEVLKRLFLLILRYGRYPIRLIDAKGYHGLIGGIFSHQGNVGAVQGGDHWNHNALCF